MIIKDLNKKFANQIFDFLELMEDYELLSEKGIKVKSLFWKRYIKKKRLLKYKKIEVIEEPKMKITKNQQKFLNLLKFNDDLLQQQRYINKIKK